MGKTMKTKLTLIQWAALLALLSTLNLQLPTVFAQGTAFTYQGRVTDNGTNFTGTGQFEFALVTSTNASRTATATANAPSGGYITGYAVTFGGNGYVTAPIVTVSGGGGSGAAAHANLTSGAVTSLAVDNPGNGGYTSTPMVLIAPPPPNISYTTYWSNDGTSVAGSEPSGAVNVAVSSGLFTVVLGDTTQPNMTTLSRVPVRATESAIADLVQRWHSRFHRIGSRAEPDAGTVCDKCKHRDQFGQWSDGSTKHQRRTECDWRFIKQLCVQWRVGRDDWRRRRDKRLEWY